jgi:Na+:H+ antiporter, NhaC family
MDLLFFVIISFVLLLFSVIKGYFIAYSLIGSMAIFIAILLKRGFKLKSLIRMAVAGSQKSFSVINILLLIGTVTAVWMAAGTVPILVYWGIKFISPEYFIFSTFILTSVISVLTGTAFGTVSTIGVALMIVASGSGVNLNMIAGAIVAGAFFGDRCSPMSSSVNLVTTITQTEVYTNFKNMAVTTLYPLIVSSILYLILSFVNPVELTNSTPTFEIAKSFDLNWINLLPALVILVLCILRIDVKLSMAISIFLGSLIGIFIQGYSLLEILQFTFTGFKLESVSNLDIMVVGGIFSMVKVSIVVIISAAFTGIFAGTRTLEFIEAYLNKAQSRSDLFLGTTVIGIFSAAFGCTQTIAILLTHQLVEKKYKKEGLDDYQLAVDLVNTAVVVSPLIPWNVVGLVPATVLSVNSGFVPYAFYLYLVPLFNLIQVKLDQLPNKHNQ